jgi:hypothetical protein
VFTADELHNLNSQLADLVPDAIEAWAAKFRDKNANYGNSWLLSGETLALWFPQGLHIKTVRQQIMHGLVVRMLDKLLRAANLELAGEQDKVGEKASETFFDLGVYAFMAGTACFIGGVETFADTLKKQARVG